MCSLHFSKVFQNENKKKENEENMKKSNRKYYVQFGDYLWSEASPLGKLHDINEKYAELNILGEAF